MYPFPSAVPTFSERMSTLPEPLAFPGHFLSGPFPFEVKTLVMLFHHQCWRGEIEGRALWGILRVALNTSIMNRQE